MKIYLLCGAHKTASTHFERALSAHAELFAKRDAAVVGPKGLREAFGPLVAEAKDGGDLGALRGRAAEILARMAPGSDTLFLCDENLLGGTEPKMLFGEGGLYPWAGRRLARFKSLFPEAKVRLALATRNLGTFLPSAYGEALHHAPYAPFEAYLAGVDKASLSWAELVSRLRAEVEVPVYVWRYEDYPHVAQSIVHELLGRGVSTKFEVTEAPSRVGLSAAAIDQLAKAKLQKKRRPDLAELKRSYPKSVLYPGLKPFSEADLEAFSMRYAEDFAQLEEMRRVTVLRPA